MKTFAFIFARGGSKGIPRKNLQDLGGKPLIGHAVECALALKEVDRVIISTDDEEIASVGKEFGADVPFMRPPELATDQVAEILAWKHAIAETEARYGAFDVIMSVPTTAPLRAPEDLSNVLKAFVPGETDFVIAVTPSRRSPYFNMVTIGEGGFAQLAVEGGLAVNRQEAPAVYDITTVAYASSPEYVLSGRKLFEGRVRAVEVPVERALDIDEPLDLEIARFLYSRNAIQR